MAGFSHPKVVASLQPPEGQPLPEPAVCLSLSPVPPGFTDCPLHAMDRRCSAGPTPSHGLAWPSRRLGNSGYISLGIHLFPRGKLLCDTCAGTLGEGEEEASCDTEGLRMTRRMTSEPPPLSQPGDAGGWHTTLALLTWGARAGLNLMGTWDLFPSTSPQGSVPVPGTWFLLRPQRRRPRLQGGKRRCLDFTAKTQGKANSGNGRMCPSILKCPSPLKEMICYPEVCAWLRVLTEALENFKTFF